MALPARVELATCGLGNRRSIHLSYGSKSLRRGAPALGRCTPKCGPAQHQRRLQPDVLQDEHSAAMPKRMTFTAAAETPANGFQFSQKGD